LDGDTPGALGGKKVRDCTALIDVCV